MHGTQKKEALDVDDDKAKTGKKADNKKDQEAKEHLSASSGGNKAKAKKVIDDEGDQEENREGKQGKGKDKSLKTIQSKAAAKEKVFLFLRTDCDLHAQSMVDVPNLLRGQVGGIFLCTDCNAHAEIVVQKPTFMQRKWSFLSSNRVWVRMCPLLYRHESSVDHEGRIAAGL